MNKILIADDHANIRKVLRLQLEGAGYTVVEAVDGECALQALKQNCDVALLDLQMPKLTGVECLRRSGGEVPIIILSAVGQIKDAVQAMNEGAYWYLQKPFEREELLHLVAKAVEVTSLRRQNQELLSSRGAISNGAKLIAESQVMQEVMAKIERIAAVDSTVLLTGESGTGKSTVARTIHQLSNRSAGPFVSVSCAALPRDLLEAELFGHEKGAFTGAQNARAGCIEVAEGGTLLLDEIGDLPLELQPKLLTFLQERSYRRLGSSKSRTSNVRIIAATNADLKAMVGGKLFREELFYRINVLTLELPPLRHRLDDVVPLAEQILARIAMRREQPKLSLSSEVVDKLRTHRWPGNVRELENVLERVTAFSTGGTVLDLPMESLPSAREIKSLAEVEHEAILAALDACGGNKSKAAKLLGISLKSIYNKLNRAV